MKEYKEYATKYLPPLKIVQQIKEDYLKLTIIEGAYANAKTEEEKALHNKVKTLADMLEPLQRMIFARNFEKGMLDRGYSMEFVAKGKNKEILEVKYVLMTYALAHQMMNTGNFENSVKMLGFKKVIFTDGYSKNWYYTFN